jgi:hypothetical protein
MSKKAEQPSEQSNSPVMDEAPALEQ